MQTKHYPKLEKLKNRQNTKLEHEGNYKNFPFFIQFVRNGYRRGYVEIETENYCSFDYGELCACENLIFFPKVIKDAKEIMLLGFETNYIYDKLDFDTSVKYGLMGKEEAEEYKKTTSYITFMPTIKTLEYCIDECKYLIDQMIDLGSIGRAANE